jgi:hypothetical protein
MGTIASILGIAIATIMGALGGGIVGAIVGAFAAWGMVGMVAMACDMASAILHDRYNPATAYGVDTETRNTLAAWVVAFVVGTIAAWVGGANETRSLIFGAFASGVVLSGIVAWVVATEAIRKHYTKGQA